MHASPTRDEVSLCAGGRTGRPDQTIVLIAEPAPLFSLSLSLALITLSLLCSILYTVHDQRGKRWDEYYPVHTGTRISRSSSSSSPTNNNNNNNKTY